MKIDLTTVIVGFEGEPIKNEKGWDPKDSKQKYEDLPNLTLADVIMKAFVTFIEEDKDEDPKDKYWRWEIGQLAYKNRNGHAEWNTDDRKKIQDRVAKVFPAPIIYGNVRDIFDPKDSAEEEDTASKNGEAKKEEVAQ